MFIIQGEWIPHFFVLTEEKLLYSPWEEKESQEEEEDTFSVTSEVGNVNNVRILGVQSELYVNDVKIGGVGRVNFI